MFSQFFDFAFYPFTISDSPLVLLPLGIFITWCVFSLAFKLFKL